MNTAAPSAYTVEVRGMSCEHCVRKVAEAILGVEGVSDAQVDLEAGRAEVQLTEPDKGGDIRDAVLAAVREAGYSGEVSGPQPEISA